MKTVAIPYNDPRLARSMIFNLYFIFIYLLCIVPDNFANISLEQATEFAENCMEGIAAGSFNKRNIFFLYFILSKLYI